MQLKARLFSEEDIEERVLWINDPQINESMFFDLPATIEKTRNWFYNKNNNYRVDFTFCDQLGQKLAMAGYNLIDKYNQNAEYYIMVNPIMHGLGLGQKVSIWVYNYGFLELKLNRIYLYTNNDNKAAYRIYEKSGFMLEGILRKHKLKNGFFLDRRIYGLLKSDWDNKNWKEKQVNYEF